jgi:hypothetical protein
MPFEVDPRVRRFFQVNQELFSHLELSALQAARALQNAHKMPENHRKQLAKTVALYANIAFPDKGYVPTELHQAYVEWRQQQRKSISGPDRVLGFLEWISRFLTRGTRERLILPCVEQIYLDAEDKFRRGIAPGRIRASVWLQGGLLLARVVVDVFFSLGAKILILAKLWDVLKGSGRWI